MIKPIKTLDLSFTRLEFYKSMVISTVKEDVLFEKKHVKELRALCNDYFEDRGFVYIANRINDYNVNPIVYIDLVQKLTLKGIAVISEDIERLKTANFEKSFSSVPFELFQNKEEAIAWAHSVPKDN